MSGVFNTHYYYIFFLLANADALLREKGLLTETSKDKPFSEELVELTIEQQLKRAQAIDDINAPSFVQQDFKSTKVWGKIKHEVRLFFFQVYLKQGKKNMHFF